MLLTLCLLFLQLCDCPSSYRMCSVAPVCIVGLGARTRFDLWIVCQVLGNYTSKHISFFIVLEQLEVRRLVQRSGWSWKKSSKICFHLLNICFHSSHLNTTNIIITHVAMVVIPHAGNFSDRWQFTFVQKWTLFTYIYIYIYMYMYCIYLYIYIERESERGEWKYSNMFVSIYISI